MWHYIEMAIYFLMVIYFIEEMLPEIIRKAVRAELESKDNERRSFWARAREAREKARPGYEPGHSAEDAHSSPGANSASRLRIWPGDH